MGVVEVVVEVVMVMSPGGSDANNDRCSSLSSNRDGNKSRASFFLIGVHLKLISLNKVLELISHNHLHKHQTNEVTNLMPHKHISKGKIQSYMHKNKS